MVLWLTALRVAASLPADLRASWIFDVVRPTAEDVRGVTERIGLLAGVLPFALAGGGIAGAYWGLSVGVVHGLFIGLFGALVLEALLGVGGAIPGTQPWRPERAELRSRWPFYLIGFLWMANGFPFVIGFPFYRGERIDMEVAMLELLPAGALWLVPLAAAAWGVRHRALHRLRTEPPLEADAFETETVTVRLT
jgi:hypothetical protein